MGKGGHGGGAVGGGHSHNAECPGDNWKVYLDKLGGRRSRCKWLIVVQTCALYESRPCKPIPVFQLPRWFFDAFLQLAALRLRT